MPAHQGSAFEADGAIAECCALRTTTHDANVLRHAARISERLPEPGNHYYCLATPFYVSYHAQNQTEPARIVEDMNIEAGKKGQGHKHIEQCFQLLIVLGGVRCAILARNLPIGSDGLSYLDLARCYLRHDWSTAVNGYWGPLYPLLVAVWLKLVHPSAAGEFAAVRAFNSLIFLLCFYSFLRFWRSLVTWSGTYCRCGLPNISSFSWMVLGYILFAVQVFWFVSLVGPDLLVASLVLMISSRLLDLHVSDATTRNYVGMGLLIAVSFYAKAILLFFGVAVLACLLIDSGGHNFRARQFRGALTAALVCVLAVTPYAFALTRVLGHFSLGESGRLNYAWLVKGTETGAWARGEASFPFFPGPVVLTAPRVFAIPKLAGITYAPWYDPGRFDKHSRATFNVHGQLRQLRTNLKSLAGEISGRHSALLVCLLALASAAPAVFLRRLAAAWFCLVPAAVVLGMYLLVFLVSRYMIGFSLLVWGVLFSCISVPANYEPIGRRVLGCGIVVFAVCTLPGVAHFLSSPSQNLIQAELSVAEALPKYGIHPGDAVGIIGDGQVAYWAHWGGVSIVGEIASMDAASFWTASPAAQQAVVESMMALGARAVVWRRDSNAPCPHNWIGLPAESGCIDVIPGAATATHAKNTGSTLVERQ